MNNNEPRWIVPANLGVIHAPYCSECLESALMVKHKFKSDGKNHYGYKFSPFCPSCGKAMRTIQIGLHENSCAHVTNFFTVIYLEYEDDGSDQSLYVEEEI